jgi:hypothetical protein
VVQGKLINRSLPVKPLNGNVTKLKRVVANLSLYQHGKRASEQGLDKMSTGEIDDEIRAARRSRKRCK